MKAHHIGVDADSGLVHTVRGTSGNVNDVVEANSLLHGQDVDGYDDAGYQGADKRPDMPRSFISLTASTLNSRLNCRLVPINYLQFHLPP